jgi:hypothetical protein
MNRKFIIVIIFVILGHLSCKYFFDSEEKKIKSDYIKTNGQVIVNAIFAFHKDYGYYPNDYDILIPRYLKSLPELQDDGLRWNYRRINDNNGFLLSAKFFGYGSCEVCYDSTDGKWVVICGL